MKLFRISSLLCSIVVYILWPHSFHCYLNVKWSRSRSLINKKCFNNSLIDMIFIRIRPRSRISKSSTKSTSSFNHRKILFLFSL